jgi:hypothetical protein
VSNQSTPKKGKVEEARGRPRPADLAPPEELPELSEEEDLVSPPIHAKDHPRPEMHDATPTLDDEVRSYHHHPNDAGVTVFGFDPEAADAAADLAGELGTQFLEGATRGEDHGDRVMEAEDALDSEMPFVIEDLEPDEQGEEGASDREEQEQEIGELEGARRNAIGAIGATGATRTRRASRPRR